MNWDNIAWGVAAVLFVVLLFVVVYLLRIRYLLNHPGSIQVALRRQDEPWRNGIAMLSDDTLDLYPTRSLSWGPSWQAVRDEMKFELKSERDGVQIVTLILPTERWDIASSGGEISALLSWIDSGAPEAEPTLA